MRVDMVYISSSADVKGKFLQAKLKDHQLFKTLDPTRMRGHPMTKIKAFFQSKAFFSEYIDNLDMIYFRLFVYVNNSTALELVFYNCQFSQQSQHDKLKASQT